MRRSPTLLCFAALGGALAGPVGAEVLSSTSPTIRNNLCIGSFCDVDESFSNDFNQLKIEHTNTRIVFDDSSTSASFADNDWAIQANEVSGGGEDQLMIVDVTAGDVEIVKIKAGAPESSLVVNGSGRLGLGTELPQADLHMSSGASGKIRMVSETYNKDWELSLGGTGLGLRELSNAGAFPFMIENGAPDSAFWVAPTGDVGLGTDGPDAPLHIRSSNADTDENQGIRVENTSLTPGVRGMFTMRNNGGSYFTLDNTDAGTTWYFVHENAAPNRFIITDAVADGPEMSLTADGDLTIPGQLFTAGSCAAGCDRVFDADYSLPSIAEQAAMMRENKHLPNVGPTPEDGPFNITAMTGGMLNELEKAHLYIAELHEQNAAMAAQMATIKAEHSQHLADLTARLEALEAGGPAH
ncbi:hypothetical protein [Pacificoceanicola onchidii]|uniref:hypothetical protein n=1 Tax=Pacificoceanicola onchidii TaxID=2562685 RepID=UPI0010A65A35|nr:hypothetical protein [Pacificoceanicola onchidii]